ncbi:hypothetical protein R3P38DRAFT_3597636 [Favolaschia claudopus]|uniref:Uncharacterized protein n=1 Tax=Favolaschia claudopus TaxID=2862362 RepID=A0AAW0AEC2_9AGAR
MIWYPFIKKTRSDAEYSPLTLSLTLPPLVKAFQASTFDYAPLVAQAVASESDNQEDHEDMDDIDEDWPPRDPLNEIDEEWPPRTPSVCTDSQHEPPSSATKRHRSPSFDEVVASSDKPHKGPHRHRPAKPEQKAKLTTQQKSTNAANARRAAKRAKQFAEVGHVAAPSTVEQYVSPATPVETELNTVDLPIKLGAYSAKSSTQTELLGSRVPRSLRELLGRGFHLVRWDGIEPHPILDRYGRIVAVLAGQPDRPDYRATTIAAFNAIQTASTRIHLPSHLSKHRRGLFAALNVGLSYGQGHTIPKWLNNRDVQGLEDELLADPNIARMAGFADAAFALWAPRLYDYYFQHNKDLAAEHPELRRPFNKSVFSCANFNLGINVWTFKHRDVLNLPFGWCAVQALGPFDHTQGGHIILWDLNLVVEFPSGALILLPSATVAHSNVPVPEGQQRTSFTQYTPGGIFRYIDQGFQTLASLEEKNPKKYAEFMAGRASRWEMGLGLLSTLDELTR